MKEPAIRYTCPFTGLPAFTRPEWKDVKLGRNYFMSVSVIGDSILMGKIVGESDLPSVISATGFMNRIIHDVFGSDQSFIYIEDFTELKNLTSDCKRYYMRFLEGQKQMKALIICTMSPLIMLAIRLSSRLKLIRYNGMVEKDIPTALKRAVEILNAEREVTGPQIETIPHLELNPQSTTISEYPEWRRMPVNDGFVSFKFIGNRILHVEFHDWKGSNDAGYRLYLEKRERVLSAMLTPTEQFVEIRNYKGVRNGITHLLDRCISPLSPEDNKRVLKHIAYNIPPFRRWFYSTRRMSLLPDSGLRLCPAYEQALESAINTLKSRGYTHTGTLNRTSHPTWHRDFGNYSVTYEVIDENVIHKQTRGPLSEKSIEGVFSLLNDVLESTGLDRRPHYLLTGLTELDDADLELRKSHFSRWADVMQKNPACRMLVMYGGNRSIRAGFGIASSLRPFSTHLAENPEDAIRVISKHKQKISAEKPAAPPRVQIDKIKVYADELMYFLGNINWEIGGPVSSMEDKEADHPFKMVYDAVSLIKSDIDDLFRERDKIQIALIEGEEVARALLNATSDASLLIRTDGTILSANETFASQVGRSPSSLKNENISNLTASRLNENRMAKLKTVALTGKPVRFEDEDDNRYYDNTIYPVFNADGTVERLALYTRDITDVKKAEKYIQTLTQEIIKAQENERQRIARDLHDNVAQDLASLIISSDTLFEGYPEIPNELRRRTMKFSQVLKRAISSIRDLAYDLRPPSLDQLGLVRTLSQYCRDFSETNGVIIDFYSAGLDKLELDFDTEINLYRLIQEALNNVKKHSGADRTTIRLVASFPNIILRIEDTGKGFDPEKRIFEALNEKRMGLKSMEERVKLLKGEFTIRSRPDEGTMILVKLPFNQIKGGWDDIRS